MVFAQTFVIAYNLHFCAHLLQLPIHCSWHKQSLSVQILVTTLSLSNSFESLLGLLKDPYDWSNNCVPGFIILFVQQTTTNIHNKLASSKLTCFLWFNMMISFAYWWRGKKFSYKTILELAGKKATECRKHLKQRARGTGMRLYHIVCMKPDKVSKPWKGTIRLSRSVRWCVYVCRYPSLDGCTIRRTKYVLGCYVATLPIESSNFTTQRGYGSLKGNGVIVWTRPHALRYVLAAMYYWLLYQSIDEPCSLWILTGRRVL